MPAKRVIFTPVIEGLYVHGLRGRVPLSLKVRLRELGLDLDRPLPSAFPVLQWEKCLHATAEALSPEVPRDEAMRRLGVLHVEGFGGSLLGRAMYAFMRTLGPRRILERLTASFRTTDNYSETRVTELGPGRYELWLNATADIATYPEGLFVALLTRCGARAVRVACTHRDDSGMTFLIQWDV